MYKIVLIKEKGVFCTGTWAGQFVTLGLGSCIGTWAGQFVTLRLGTCCTGTWAGQFVTSVFKIILIKEKVVFCTGTEYFIFICKIQYV